MSTTDFLHLNESAMFAKIRNCLPVEKQHTQNLLECKDDLLYAWNAQESCLLVVNWRVALTRGHENIQYQTLLPSTHITFEVERVLSSNEGSLIALAGPRGVCILELPQRWGSSGQFMQDKPRITCRAHNLDTQLFGNNTHLHIRQLRWHCASPTDSHLLVLLSDNTIRIYDNGILRHVWQVGPLPLRNDVNPNSSIVYALGETVVDFDIAPAVCNNASVDDDSKELTIINSTITHQHSSTTIDTAQTSIRGNEKIEWPLIILRENGNIYILMTSLDTERPRLQGPLTITPAQTDNYGLDSCSILVIPSLPPALVIAETNGKLHHALLLEAETAENSFNEVDESIIIHPSEWVLHVLETVELELGLPRENSNPEVYYSPIHLKRDFINELRYFAYHNAGLHVITINFIAELQRFLESDVDSDITSLMTASHAEYILCTKIDSSEHVNAVLGFVLMQMPSTIVLLLSSGQVISLKLVIDPRLLNEPQWNNPEMLYTENMENTVEQTQLNEMLNCNFVDCIKSLLRRDITQPLLSLDKTATTPTPRDCYELLIQAIEVLRTQYLKKHDAVRAEFTKRVNTIKLWKEQQKQDIDDLEKERHTIRDKAHKLAEKFEELSEHQEVLTKRCQDLMRQAHTCLPSNSLAEKEFIKEVECVNKTTKKMQANLQKSKDTMNKQNYHIMKYRESGKKKQYELPEVQERTIKEIFLQMNAEIDEQIKEVKRISKLVSL